MTNNVGDVYPYWSIFPPVITDDPYKAITVTPPITTGGVTASMRWCGLCQQTYFNGALCPHSEKPKKIKLRKATKRELLERQVIALERIADALERR